MQVPVRGIRMSPTKSMDDSGDVAMAKLMPRPSFLMGDAVKSTDQAQSSDDAYAAQGDVKQESTEPAKQSRLQTIASLVNTMMGTTIVSLPYGLSESGIGSGMIVIFVLGACSCYTALILARASAPGEEFSRVVARYLGPRVQIVSWAISLAIIVGAAIVYHILMQETLYALVETVADGVGHSLSDTVWRREYAALLPWILYPVSNLKDMSALVKFNSTGFIFLWYTILFMWSHGIRTLTNGGTTSGSMPIVPLVTQPADGSAYAPDGRLRVILGGSISFAGLGGMMMLSFFLHNCFQSIVKNADPKTVHVDMGIAYVIAGVLYAAVGVLGYIGMADAHTAAECAWGDMQSTSPCTLSSNFLAMFGTGLGDSWSIYALSARVSLLLQLFTVFPLLLLIIRNQVWGFVAGTAWPSFTKVAGLNFAVMAATFAFAAVDAKVSEVLRFVGAIGGLVIVYAVPLAVHAAQRRLGEKTAGRKGSAGARNGIEASLFRGSGGGSTVDEEALAGLLDVASRDAAEADGDATPGDGKAEAGQDGTPVPLPPSSAIATLDVAVMGVGLLFFTLQFVPELSGS